MSDPDLPGRAKVFEAGTKELYVKARDATGEAVRAFGALVDGNVTVESLDTAIAAATNAALWVRMLQRALEESRLILAAEKSS